MARSKELCTHLLVLIWLSLATLREEERFLVVCISKLGRCPMRKECMLGAVKGKLSPCRTMDFWHLIGGPVGVLQVA